MSTAGSETFLDELRQTRAIDLLAEDGIPVSNEMLKQLARFNELILEWNPSASLVSLADATRLAQTHIPDALSIAAIIQRHTTNRALALLDIGSGGGFPAIPLKVVLPGMPLILIERTTKKVGFLRKVAASLGLREVTIHNAEFTPRMVTVNVGAVTARAVEKPKGVLKKVSEALPEGVVFVCQSGNPQSAVGPRFHVEHIVDKWTEAKLRRGDLFLVTRAE